MKKNQTWPLALLAFAVGCGGANENSNYLPMTRKNVTTEAVDKATKSLGLGKGAKVVQGATDFSFNLFRAVSGDAPKENQFISPISVALALGMTYNGAAGGTKDGFEKTLGVENALPNEVNQAYKDLQTTLVGADKQVVVQIANGLWLDKKFEFKRDFTSRIADFYGAKVQTVEMGNPATVNAINDWVKEETEQLIPKLFEKLEDNTKAVLVNAVYFNGKWTTPFDRASVKDVEFTGFDGKAKAIPMMSRHGEDIDYLKSEKFDAIRLPYGDARVQMSILLPVGKNSVGAVLKDLNAKNWTAWSAKFKAMSGTVTIPKWKSEASYDLVPTLKSLGLGAAFDATKADFSGMASVKPGELAISQVVHKSVVSVDEVGTEAAAATGVAVAGTSAPVEAFTFVANRPFVYLITDKTTGVALFLGIYGKP